MMSESLDSRRLERKPLFDVPLPMRRARETAPNPEEPVVEAPQPTPAGTMKFSLLSKRGNKQQVDFDGSMLSMIPMLTYTP
jgi:regulator of nonsense transcripts 2